MAYIIQYNENCKKHWNNFLQLCKNYHFMFYREFMEYHSDRFDDMSLMIYNDKNNIIALFPANHKNGVFYSHQGLTFGGLLVDKNMTAATLLGIFDEIKLFLKEQGIHKIIYKCIPYIYHNYPCQEELYVLFRNNATLYRRDISTCIDLTQEHSYKKGKKWSVNKAKKSSLLTRKIDKPSEVWFLVNEILEKQHNAKPVHNEFEIDLLSELFPNNIHCYVSLLAEEVLALAVIFIHKDVIHTQYLACGSKGREIGALDLLIHELILMYKGKARYFDFGISNEQNGWYLNDGLISQKEGFGGRGVVHDFYELEV